MWPSGAARLADGTVIELAAGRAIGRLDSADGEVVRVGQGWVLAEVVNGRPRISSGLAGAAEAAPFDLATRRFFRADSGLFAVTENSLVRVSSYSATGFPRVSVGAAWGIRPNATRWFDGIAVQDVLGAAFLLWPIDDGIQQIKVPQLDRLTPVAGIAAGKFASIVAADRSGAYRRIEVTMRSNGSTTVWEGPNDGPAINMAVLPRGVVSTIVTDGELVIFVPTTGEVRKIQDADLRTDMQLCRWDDRVLFLRDGDVWRLRVK